MWNAVVPGLITFGIVIAFLAFWDFYLGKKVSRWHRRLLKKKQNPVIFIDPREEE